MRVGILGGTFDPIHNGHMALAKAALRQLKLDKVAFVLSPRSPFKLKHHLVSVAGRLAMVRLAVKQHRRFAAVRWELQRRGPSYMVTTIADYKKRHPSHQLFLILGSDALQGLPRWKNPEKIVKLATLVVGRRPEVSVAECLPGVTFLRGSFPNVSSTGIRSMFAKNRRAKAPVPPPVRSYILRRKLYSSPHGR